MLGYSIKMPYDDMRQPLSISLVDKFAGCDSLDVRLRDKPDAQSTASKLLALYVLPGVTLFKLAHFTSTIMIHVHQSVCDLPTNTSTCGRPSVTFDFAKRQNHTRRCRFKPRSYELDRCLTHKMINTKSKSKSNVRLQSNPPSTSMKWRREWRDERIRSQKEAIMI